MSNHEKQFAAKVGAVYRTCVLASDYEELLAVLELAKIAADEKYRMLQVLARSVAEERDKLLIENERLTESLTNMQAQRDRIAENLRFERELYAANPGGFPFNPTEAQWGGLARDIVWWTRSYPSNKHTPATLMEHLGNLGREIPAWMGEEAELRTQDHVISKGTVAVLIYKAMLADYRGTE